MRRGLSALVAESIHSYVSKVLSISKMGQRQHAELCANITRASAVLFSEDHSRDAIGAWENWLVAAAHQSLRKK